MTDAEIEAAGIALAKHMLGDPGSRLDMILASDLCNACTAALDARRQLAQAKRDALLARFPDRPLTEAEFAAWSERMDRYEADLAGATHG